MAKIDGGGKARQGDKGDSGGKVGKHRGAKRVERPNWVAMDVHCGGTEGGWTDHAGVERGRFRCPTAIPELRAEVEKVPRPRVLDFGELSRAAISVEPGSGKDAGREGDVEEIGRAHV